MKEFDENCTDCVTMSYGEITSLSEEQQKTLGADGWEHLVDFAGMVNRCTNHKRPVQLELFPNFKSNGKNKNGPLYSMGGAHPNAMRGLATGAKLVRKQEILTPESVVRFVLRFWDVGSIQLDPCSSGLPEELTKARVSYTAEGLELPWSDCTYVNPPFKDLKKWMHKASLEAEKGHRIVMLCPVRGHRDWWHEYRDTASGEVQLKPLKFVGYAGAFPAPLCLLIWNGIDGHDIEDLCESVGLRLTKVVYL